MTHDLVSDFQARGLVHQSTDAARLREWLATPGRRVYAGFDPTADSLHVGHLVALVLLRRVAAAGHEPVALIGGATGMIGDPSGRSEERNLLSPEELAANIAGVERQIGGILGTAETEGQVARHHVVNNADWMRGVGYLEFLRDVGKHVPLSQMLGKDSVKSRLERDGGLSYTEFSYMLLQAFDYLHLYQTKRCRLQIGGSDQWGNLTAGLELIRRKIQGEAYALSFPLITNSEGKKFGKSEGNAVWLDPSMTSPYKFHQFWLNVPDGDVIRLIKVFTFESKQRVDSIEAEMLAQPEKRAAQQLLADSVCTLVHGAQATIDAKRSADALFSGSLEGLSSAQLFELFKDAPTTTITEAQVRELDLLGLLSVTVAKSKGEARRLVQGGGIYLDNARVSDEALKLKDTAIQKQGFIVIRSGKKNYHLVRLQNG